MGEDGEELPLCVVTGDNVTKVRKLVIQDERFTLKHSQFNQCAVKRTDSP